MTHKQSLIALIGATYGIYKERIRLLGAAISRGDDVPFALAGSSKTYTRIEMTARMLSVWDARNAQGCLLRTEAQFEAAMLNILDSMLNELELEGNSGSYTGEPGQIVITDEFKVIIRSRHRS